MNEGGTGRTYLHVQDLNVRRILFKKPEKQRSDEKPCCKLKGNTVGSGVSGPDHRVDGPTVPSETYIYTYIPCIPSVSQRRQDVERVINAQIYTVFTV